MGLRYRHRDWRDIRALLVAHIKVTNCPDCLGGHFAQLNTHLLAPCVTRLAARCMAVLAMVRIPN
jgi:hypothetical protein